VSRTAVARFEPHAVAADLRQRLARATDAALAAGAAEAEAFGAFHQSVAVSFEKGDLKLTQVDEGASVGVRVFQDRRLGFASTNQSDDASLAQAARDAVGLARFNPPDDANVLPEARRAEPLNLVDERLAAIEVEEVVALGRELVTRATAPDRRISLDQASLTLSRTVACIQSSAGVDVREADCAIGFSVFGMVVDGEDVGGFHYCADTVRDPGRLDAAIARACEEFAATALGNLGAGAAESYRGRVLFSPSALLSVFVSPLVSASSAIAVQRGRSAFAGKIGERVAAPGVHVVDDPRDAALSGAGGFDREGTPALRFTLVEDGVLRGYLYNGYAARVDGVYSTGHAKGGARSVPGLGPHALSVGAGPRGKSRRELLCELGRGLFVQRFSGTVDPASGDFSGVAKSARWVEGGEIVRPVRETLLSGNAFELLRTSVVLSRDVEVVNGSARAPYALVDGVSVTAG
jgi:PmbA protein